MKKYLLSIGILTLFLLLVISIRPISLSKSDTIQITGTVQSTSYDENNHDLSFKIIGDDRIFYINRALEKGLRPNELKKELQGSFVKFSYADQWTILDPSGQFRHITELSIADNLLFSEFRK